MRPGRERRDRRVERVAADAAVAGAVGGEGRRVFAWDWLRVIGDDPKIGWNRRDYQCTKCISRRPEKDKRKQRGFARSNNINQGSTRFKSPKMLITA